MDGLADAFERVDISRTPLKIDVYFRTPMGIYNGWDEFVNEQIHFYVHTCIITLEYSQATAIYSATEKREFDDRLFWNAILDSQNYNRITVYRAELVGERFRDMEILVGVVDMRFAPNNWSYSPLNTPCMALEALFAEYEDCMDSFYLWRNIFNARAIKEYPMNEQYSLVEQLFTTYQEERTEMEAIEDINIFYQYI